MEKEFGDYPIEIHDGLYYIAVDTWKNARTIQELWNSEMYHTTKMMAQSPEYKDWGEFKAGLVYIWLRQFYV
jgi:hypothetical protein